MHFQILDRIDTLKRMSFLSEDGARKVNRTLEDLGRVFFKDNEKHLSKEQVGNELFRQYEMLGKTSKWVRFDDRRKK